MQTPSSKSFTLIELLVVVAIIAVLVALLLPALSMARSHALRITCSTNLKGIQRAFRLYLDDYQGSFPPWYVTSGVINEWERYRALKWQHILSGERNICPQYFPDRSPNISRALRCPTDPNNTWDSSYSVNYVKFRYIYDPGLPCYGGWLYERDLEFPERVIMVYCNGNGYGGGAPDGPDGEGRWGDWTTLRHRDVHNGGYPILWFDGHVTFEDEWITQVSAFWNGFW